MARCRFWCTLALLALAHICAVAQPVEMTQIGCPPGYRAWALVELGGPRNDGTAGASTTVGPCGLALRKEDNALFICFENARAVHRVFPDGAIRIVARADGAIEPLDISPDGSFALVAYDGGSGLVKISELDPDKVTPLSWNAPFNTVRWATFNYTKNQRLSFDSQGYVYTGSMRISPDGQTQVPLGNTNPSILYDRTGVSLDDQWYCNAYRRIRIRDRAGDLINDQDWEPTGAPGASGEFDSEGNLWTCTEGPNQPPSIHKISASYWQRLSAADVGTTADMRVTPSEVTEVFTGCGSLEDVVIDSFGTLFASDESNDVLMMITYNDDDGDQIPNSWETQYSLNPNDFADGFADPDNDGVDNLHEYWNGTSPRDSDAVAITPNRLRHQADVPMVSIGSSFPGRAVRVTVPVTEVILSARIYSLQGHLVRELLSPSRPNNSIVWDTRNSRGHHVPSGTYQVQLTTGRQALSCTIRLLLGR